MDDFFKYLFINGLHEDIKIIKYQWESAYPKLNVMVKPKTAVKHIDITPSPIKINNMDQTITMGRIVEFVPAENKRLANNAESAPAMALQCFGARTNLHVFTCDETLKSSHPADSSRVVETDIKGGFTAWSICHESEALPGEAFWRWPKRVETPMPKMEIPGNEEA